LKLSQLVLPISSGTLGWDGQLGFDLSVMGPVGIILPLPSCTLGWDGFELSVTEPLGIIPSCLCHPKWYNGIEENPLDICWQCWTSVAVSPF